MERSEFIRSDSPQLHVISTGGAECALRLHQQRSVCMWGCSSDTDGVSCRGLHETVVKSRGGAREDPTAPEQMEASQTLITSRCLAPSLLPLVLGGSKGNLEAGFFVCLK